MPREAAAGACQGAWSREMPPWVGVSRGFPAGREGQGRALPGSADLTHSYTAPASPGGSLSAGARSGSRCRAAPAPLCVVRRASDGWSVLLEGTPFLLSPPRRVRPQMELSPLGFWTLGDEHPLVSVTPFPLCFFTGE